MSRAPRIQHEEDDLTLRESGTSILLRILQGGAEFTADYFDTYTCGYGESYRRARGKWLGSRPRIAFKESWGDQYLEKQRFYRRLTKLRASGLIVKENTSKGTKWSLTKEGVARIVPVVLAKDSEFPTIISYDIPEPLRKERGWLRQILAELNFKLVHQSLWVGHKKFTELFLRELKERKIFEHIHLMEVSRTGTVNIQ